MIVLDTHAWVWWVAAPERVPERARAIVEGAVEDGETVRLSCISAWEVALLVERGRLELTMDVTDWVAKSEALPFIEFVPVDDRIALRAVQLPGFPHRDPADRIIVSTALGLGATLVTGDERLHGYEPVRTVWS